MISLGYLGLTLYILWNILALVGAGFVTYKYYLNKEKPNWWTILVAFVGFWLIFPFSLYALRKKKDKK